LEQLLEAGFLGLDLTLFAPEHREPLYRDASKLLAALPPANGRVYRAGIDGEKQLFRALAAKRLNAAALVFGQGADWGVLARAAAAVRGRLALVVEYAVGAGSFEETLAWAARAREFGVGRILFVCGPDGFDPGRAYALGGRLVAAFGSEAVGMTLRARIRPEEARAWLDAVLTAGVRWLEGVLDGEGVGFLPSELALTHLVDRGFDPGVELTRLPKLLEAVNSLKARYGER